MKKKDVRFIFFFSGICVPFLFLLSPRWLSINGVGPYWTILWLLPWSLGSGKFFGSFSGLCLGLLIDSISIGGVSQIPALMALGFWWGKEGEQEKPFDVSLHLGLLALLGAIICGASAWIQSSFLEAFNWSSWFHSWALHTLLAKAILTGLLAPMTCSWILLARRAPNKQK